LSAGVTAVIHATNAEECRRYIAASIKGGIKAIEITMTVRGPQIL
jgi:2-keto-3-deoxy-6-phosphogluconate aldolase